MSINTSYYNNKGKQFSLKHVSYGLDDFDHSSAFTYLDMDNDGDLDIIGNTTYGGLKVFKSNEKGQQSIAFEINHKIGNADCIGCKILVSNHKGKVNLTRLVKVK